MSAKRNQGSWPPLVIPPPSYLSPAADAMQNLLSKTRYACDRGSGPIFNLVLVSCFATLGCTNKEETPIEFELSSPAPIGWDMLPENAVRTAIRYANDNKIQLHRYNEPRVGNDVFEDERFWSVLYVSKSRIVGDDFMLLINDTTKTVEYVAGE